MYTTRLIAAESIGAAKRQKRRYLTHISLGTLVAAGMLVGGSGMAHADPDSNTDISIDTSTYTSTYTSNITSNISTGTTTTSGTIAQLQSDGYTVTITRTGTGPLDQCKVTDVGNPNTTTYTTRSHEGASGVNTITISKTIDVTLDCT